MSHNQVQMRQWTGRPNLAPSSNLLEDSLYSGEALPVLYVYNVLLPTRSVSPVTLFV